MTTALRKALGTTNIVTEIHHNYAVVFTDLKLPWFCPVVLIPRDDKKLHVFFNCSCYMK